MTEPELRGRAAAITGAASGIGRATALALAAQGVRLLLGDIDEAGLEATAQAARDLGAEAIAQRLDVTEEADVVAFFARGGRDYGGIDLAFNNAGTDGPFGPLAVLELADFERIFAVNVRGIFLCLREAVRGLRARRAQGAIVNTASMLGLVGAPMMPVYSASKHAVIGLTRSAAAKYAAQGIRINALCPGCVDTPMLQNVIAGDEKRREALTQQHPIGRLGTVEEMAGTVVFLLSPAASFITGQALAADGGCTAV